MGYKKTDKCIEKAFDDELLFVLMARDVTAPLVVIDWIKQNVHIQPPDKLHEALDCAIEMARGMGNHRFHADHPKVWEMQNEHVTRENDPAVEELPYLPNNDARLEREKRISG
jgi:hypothetical protein